MRAVVYLLAVLVLLSVTGCSGKSGHSLVQETMTKNGVVTIGNKQADNVQAEKPQSLVWGIAKLGALEELPSIQEWSPIAHEEVAVSADGKYVAVAAFDGNVYLYDKTGKKLWDYRIQSGLPVSVAFAADGGIIFVGESSTDANLYAFDTSSGKLLWQYNFSGQIGSGASSQWSNRPKVRELTASGDMVIAAGEYRQRFVEKSGERSIIRYVTKCVVIAFDGKTGKQCWQYPAEGTMDTGASKIAVSEDGQKVVFSNHSWTPGVQQYPDGSIRVLNGKTGQIAASYQIDIMEPYFKWVGIYDGIEISPNGEYFVTFLTDNRAMLFDLSAIDMQGKCAQLQPSWTQQVSKIHNVGGIPVYASGSVAYVTNEGNVYLMTSLTYLADKTAAAAPPFNHPDTSTLFAYDRQGELLWRWQTEGGLGKVRLSSDSRFLVAAVYHNYVTRQKERAGLYCFDLQATGNDSLAWFYPVEGVAVAADIAADGTTIAVSESPIRMENAVPTGEHRLHILQ